MEGSVILSKYLTGRDGLTSSVLRAQLQDRHTWFSDNPFSVSF
jgi:hypothetical protein